MKKSWLIAGVLVSCGMGASIAACGSSTTPGGAGASGTSSHASTTSTNSTSTSTSGSTTAGSTSGSTSTGGANTTSSTSGTGGAGGSAVADCPDAAPTLYPPEVPDGGGYPDFYCPFSKVDGGKTQYCPGGGTQECCETPEDAGVPSSCMALGSTSCPSGSTTWGCDDPAECPTGNICCGTPYTGKNVSIKESIPGCTTEYYASDMGGTACMAAAACTSGGGVIMCTSNAECTSPQKCVPFEKAGNHVGACQ